MTNAVNKPQSADGESLTRRVNGTPAEGSRAPAAPPGVPDESQAASELWAALRRYEQLFTFLPDPSLITDGYGNIEEANQAALDLLGRPREFIIGKPLPVFIAQNHRWAFYERFNRLRAGMEPPDPWQMHIRRRGDDSTAVAEIHATVLGRGQSGPSGLLWVLRDVTQQKHLEERLRGERLVMESIVSTAQVIVLVLDVHGRIVRHNAFAEEMSGRRADELRGRVWWDCLVRRAEKTQARDWFLGLAASGVSSCIRTLQDKSGRDRVVGWSGTEIPEAKGSGTAVLLIGHDVTELQDAHKAAFQTERLATVGRMTAVITHESRNAIQRTHACLERLGWKLENQLEALDLVRRAQKAQDDLRRLFDDVRDFAVPIRLNHERRDVAEVWRRAWAEVTALCPERDAKLVEHVDCADPLCFVDPFHLRRVFRNLFENSLAACHDPVRVGVTCRDANLAGKPALELWVRDNGPGLTEEQQLHAFEPFFTTKAKGTGLGLAIVHDPSGEPGAEFVIVLPRSITDEAPPESRGRR